MRFSARLAPTFPAAGISPLIRLDSSISIACWVVVFSPQIIENFRRQSADGLSLVFLIIWLAGDVFNILGAVLQGVLPTMIILAVYYTLADIVLLGQCFYYRGFNIREEFSASPTPEPNAIATGALNSDTGAENARSPATERSSLLPKPNGQANAEDYPTSAADADQGRRFSASSFHSFRGLLNSSVDGTHLSPATPFVDPSDTARARRRQRRISTIQAIAFNSTAIALVCAAGILGWYFSPGSKKSTSDSEPLTLDVLGQVFGYFCAVLYLGSRIPQLLLNFRRKSTDGVSLLFFLFACIGNLTYVLSILAYSPVCRGSQDVGPLRHHAKCQPGEAKAIYGRYILVNLSWLVGSFGTLLLDMAIFVQFFLYREAEKIDEDE